MIGDLLVSLSASYSVSEPDNLKWGPPTYRPPRVPTKLDRTGHVRTSNTARSIASAIATRACMWNILLKISRHSVRLFSR